MRELSQEEFVETTHMESHIVEHHQNNAAVLDKAGRVSGVVTRKVPLLIGHGGDGFKLAQILQKAAGLDGFKLKSIECRIATREVITFKAEIMGTAEDIAAAIAANEENEPPSLDMGIQKV